MTDTAIGVNGEQQTITLPSGKRVKVTDHQVKVLAAALLTKETNTRLA